MSRDTTDNTEFLRMSSGYNSETLSFPVATRQYPMAWVSRMSSSDITLELLEAISIIQGAAPWI